MSGVIEIETDIFEAVSNPVRLPKLVTGRTRSDISIAGDGVGFVTLKTSDVRVGASRNVHSAGALRCVAGRAVGFLEMLLVIKIRLKASHRRKRLELVGIRLGVANNADRMLVILELRRVTADAR